MSQPSTRHLFKTVPFAQPRRALRRAWVAIALSAVCGLASVTVNAKPMSESAIQSRTVRSDEVGVVLQTRRGDSLRTIAQYYSVKNNIPFKQALEILTQTNQAQFPGGDPDRMQVGAQIVLPKQGTAASESSKPEPTVAASSANETTAASSAGAATNATQAAIVPAAPAAPAPSASPPQTEPTVSTQAETTTAAQGGMAQLKAWFLRVPKSLWLVIIPALLLSAFVWLMMRGSRQGKDDGATDDLTANEATEKVTPSTVAPIQAEQVAQQVAQTVDQTPAPIIPNAPEAALSVRSDSTHADADKLISNETVDSWLDGSETPTQVVAESVQSVDAERPTVTAVPAAVQPPVIVESLPAQAEASAQADSVKTAETVTQTNHVAAQEKTLSAEVADERVDVKPEAAQEIELRFKQALHGLTPEKLDLRSTSASKVQFDTPAAAIAPTMPAVPVTVAATMPNATQTTATAAPSDSGASGLNVNHLLRQYANHTAEKSGQAVNYYALAERTRLQKWMSAQSMDDLLDHAQKAYAQAYPNVAHHILNEVILRGNAAQSTQALDLRNQWHIQYLRQQAQESRGH